MTESDDPEFIPVAHELAESVFDTRDPSDPRFCGYRWWMNLLHRDGWMWALIDGTVPGREDYWGDYSQAAAYLDGFSPRSELGRTERDDVLSMRFLRLPDDQVSGDEGAFVKKGGIVEGRVINLVRCSDATWRVWSLGPLDLAEIPEIP